MPAASTHTEPLSSLQECQMHAEDMRPADRSPLRQLHQKIFKSYSLMKKLRCHVGTSGTTRVSQNTMPPVPYVVRIRESSESDPS